MVNKICFCQSTYKKFWYSKRSCWGLERQVVEINRVLLLFFKKHTLVSDHYLASAYTQRTGMGIGIGRRKWYQNMSILKSHKITDDVTVMSSMLSISAIVPHLVRYPQDWQKQCFFVYFWNLRFFPCSVMGTWHSMGHTRVSGHYRSTGGGEGKDLATDLVLMGRFGS